MNTRAANLYRKVDLDSAPKSDVLCRLYDRCVADLDVARAAIVRRDIPTKAAALDHALRIIAELEAALDHAAAPEIAKNLAALYHFVTDRITRANVALDVAAIDDATRIVRQIGDAFREAQHR